MSLLPLVAGEVMVCTEDLKSGVGLWHAVITVSDLLCEREGSGNLSNQYLYRGHMDTSVYLGHLPISLDLSQ